MKRNHKAKELDQLQTAKRENENLKKEVKKLRKQLKRQVEREYIEEDEVEIVEMRQYKTPKEMVDCPKCLKGTLNKLELGIHKLNICDTCTYRKVILKGMEN